MEELSPALLFSLGTALVSLLSLVLSSLGVSVSFLSDDCSVGLGFGGAVQLGTCQTTPVKLLS